MACHHHHRYHDDKWRRHLQHTVVPPYDNIHCCWTQNIPNYSSVYKKKLRNATWQLASQATIKKKMLFDVKYTSRQLHVSTVSDTANIISLIKNTGRKSMLLTMTCYTDDSFSSNAIRSLFQRTTIPPPADPAMRGARMLKGSLSRWE